MVVADLIGFAHDRSLSSQTVVEAVVVVLVVEVVLVVVVADLIRLPR